MRAQPYSMFDYPARLVDIATNNVVRIFFRFYN
jgi:hypothetical protein